MLSTPSTSHVNYDHVYEPAEDSYLVLDTLSSNSEVEFLGAKFQATSPAPVILEVGTGSGVVLAFVTAHALPMFGRSDILTLGIDVNQFACSSTVKTVKLAQDETKTQPGYFLGSLTCDLAGAIKPGSVDVLIFNPPYVPSETLPSMRVELDSASKLGNFARDSHLISLSTDGGADGMETTNRLLDQLDTLLSHRGVAYILLCAQNKPEAVISRVEHWPATSPDGILCSWSAERVASSGQKAGWERLCVIRIWRTINPL